MTVPRSFASLFVLSALALLTPAVHAQAEQACGDSSSVLPDGSLPPISLWQNSVFEPLPVSSLRTSGYNGNGFPQSGFGDLWNDIDYAEGALFTTAPWGYQVWGVSTPTTAADPTRLHVGDGWSGEFPSWGHPGELDTPVLTGDATYFGGRHYYAYAALNGLAVVEVDINGTRVTTQTLIQICCGTNGNKYVDVAFAVVGTKLYLYARNDDGTQGGIDVFDVSSRIGSTSACTSTTQSSACGYRGRLAGAAGGIVKATAGRLHALDGGANEDALLLAPNGGGYGATLISIDPTNNQNGTLGTKLYEYQSNTPVGSAALWRTASGVGVAVKSVGLGNPVVIGENTLKFFNATSCVNGGSCGGSPVETLSLAGRGQHMEAGESNGRSYLWWGEKTQCPNAGLREKELFYDVSDLNDPQDITPNTRQTISGRGTSSFVNMFEYYYNWAGATGFSRLSPSAVVFYDGYMARAMENLFDTFRLGDQEPVISLVNPPAVVFHNTPTAFQATAANCTPSNNSGWVWSTGEASQITGDTDSNQVSIEWTDTQVTSDTVTVSHPDCPNAEDQATVTLEDPSARITELFLNGQALSGNVTVTQCQDVTLSADVVGLAPITYSWTLSAGAPTSSSSPTFVWNGGAANPTQVSVDLTLTNNANPQGDSLQRTFDLIAVDQLTDPDPTFVQNPAGGATVVVQANVQGATSYVWEYRDVNDVNWTTHTNNGGPQETISFTAIGDYVVRVTASNCIEPQGRSGETDTIEVTNVNPPAPDFQMVGCSAAGCFADAGQAVTFSDQSGGDITEFRYNFLNTSTTTCTPPGSHNSASPIESFTFAVPGNYRPCVVASGPGGTETFIHSLVRVSSAQPASIGVSCSPSAVNTGQSTTCNAFASNCTANPSGWNWSTAGGGSSTSSQAVLSWGSIGNKTVLVSNSGCGGASGSARVTVSSPGGGGGGGGGGGTTLAAVIQLSNTTPAQNETVTLDGRASTGAIVGYSWRVRLNGETVGTYSGSVASHTFTQAGAHEVTLSVFDQTGCTSPGCLAETKTTVVVGGNGLNAAFTTSPAAPEQGDDLVLNAGGSSGNIVAYLWTVSPPSGPDSEFSGQAVLLPLDQAGAYQIDLEIRSEANCADASCRAFASKTVNVAASNVLEARYVIQGGGPPLVGKFFTLDARVSTGNPDAYEWEVDGQVILGETLTLRFNEVGFVPIKLTVRRGASSDTLLDNLEVVADCDPADDVLCLFNRRFRVDVTWEDFQGQTGVGTPRPESTENSGLFWFFSVDNVEMVVKILDGCSINDNYWVSLAATTNVAYQLTVEDLISGAVYTTTNALGNPAPALLDLDALPVCDEAAVESPSLVSWYLPSDEEVAQARAADAARELAEREQALEAAARWQAEQDRRLELASASQSGIVAGESAVGTCVPSSTTFCFEDNRFQVSVNFKDQTGQSGFGLKSVVETADSGVFYFFDPNNWEMLVKMVEGCAFNDHFWIFSAATTDQEYTLSIVDTVTGEELSYYNPLKTLAPAVTDIEAFPCTTE